jgi:hypothetical protein
LKLLASEHTIVIKEEWEGNFLVFNRISDSALGSLLYSFAFNSQTALRSHHNPSGVRETEIRGVKDLS